MATSAAEYEQGCQSPSRYPSSLGVEDSREYPSKLTHPPVYQRHKHVGFASPPGRMVDCFSARFRFIWHLRCFLLPHIFFCFLISLLIFSAFYPRPLAIHYFLDFLFLPSLLRYEPPPFPLLSVRLSFSL